MKYAKPITDLSLVRAQGQGYIYIYLQHGGHRHIYLYRISLFIYERIFGLSSQTHRRNRFLIAIKLSFSTYLSTHLAGGII